MTLRKPLALVIGAIAAFSMLAGCSSGGGGSSTEKFCKTAGQYDDIDEDNIDAMVDALTKMAADAPADLKEDITFLRDSFTKFEGVDMEDSAAVIKATEGMDMDRLQTVSSGLGSKLVELCAPSK